MAAGLGTGTNALRKGVKYGLTGAALGAGLYGAKKLMDKYNPEPKTITGKIRRRSANALNRLANTIR